MSEQKSAGMPPATEAWQSLEPPKVAEKTGSDLERGLDAAEAAARLKAVGPNEVQPARVESVWQVFLELIREPLMLLLFGIGILYGIWGSIQDALTILAIVLIMVGTEVVNDYRASKTIAGLSKLAEPTTRVIRGGVQRELPSTSVVPGDVLIVSSGRRVPADARLIDSFGLSVDESALTGESMPVQKNAQVLLPATASLADRVNMVYAGTLPVRGRGSALVVETAARTELGKIAAATAEAEQPETPLQKTINELSKWMLGPALAISVLVPVLGIALLHEPVRQMILTGLSLVFAMIPEELPLIITMILAIGCYRLAKRGALVKRMAAAETLGDVSVILSDKTGTLTEGRLSLSQVEPPSARDQVLQLAALTVPSDATDPFDVAFLDAAGRSGIDAPALQGASALVNEFPFENTRDRMSVVRQSGNGFEVVVRGAPEAVLAQCVLAPDETQRFMRAAGDLAGSGLRVLALATKTVESAPADANAAESDLTFSGLAGFIDPPRGEVAAAVAQCQQAGIRVLMVTGDHPETAIAIARMVGIKSDAIVLGPEVDRMSDEQLTAALAKSPILARCTPANKQRIVASLEKSGEFVAVTGDGINDAPALALAHVGVAMGKRGTDVAREAATVVLADDNFATVERAVEEGRVIHANLRKGVRFYLAFKFALAGATLIPVLLLFPVAFAPIQIILTEFFMDVGGSTSFVAEPPEEGLMKGRSYDPRARFMDRSMLLGILGGAIGLGLAVILAYTLAPLLGASLATSQTMAFVTLLLGTALLAANMRSEKEPLYKLGFTSNVPILLWSTAMVVFALIVVLVPAVHGLFKTTYLTGAEWAVVVGFALAGTVWMELVKVVRTMVHAGSGSPRVRAQVA